MTLGGIEELRISRAGKVIGTFKPARVQELLVTGVLLRTDHYWRPGMTGWGQLDEPGLDLSAMRVVDTPSPSARPVVHHFDEADADQDESRLWVTFLSIKVGAAGIALLGVASAEVDALKVIQVGQSIGSRYSDSYEYSYLRPGSIGKINAFGYETVAWFAGWLLCVIIANSAHTYLVRKAAITRQLKLIKASTEK